MYWTLETRPPTLDEQIDIAKQRHAQRVEEIAAEEPVPQIPLPSVPHKGSHCSGRFGQQAAIVDSYRTLADVLATGLPEAMFRPGECIEVSDSELAAYRQRIAYQQLAAQQSSSTLYAVGADAAQTGIGAAYMGLHGVRRIPPYSLFDMECA